MAPQKFASEFKRFLLRGNVVDLLIGFTVGAAFTDTARSLIDNLVMPPVGFILGGADFSNAFLVVVRGPNWPYSDLKMATADGALTLNYGLFFNSLFSLILVALVMFVIIKFWNQLEKKEEKPIHLCPNCQEKINQNATRCPHCTSRI